MAEEKKSIFRQKSLERISSPEELDQYLQVTRPSTWLVLGAVVILLIGFLSWGVLGHLTSRLPVAVSVEDGRAICYIPESQAELLKSSEIKIGEQTYVFQSTGLAKMLVNSETPADVKMCGYLTEGDVICPYVIDGQLEDGYYQGEIIIEQMRPINFILN